MNKQTQEALKMAIGFASVISETYSTGGEAEKVINACKEALEQPTKSITEGATMFKQVGNSPKPSPPPPIHTCTYSRTINQEYPRKCVHCGKVEALEQPAQEPLTRAQQVILANNKALEPVACLENGNVNWAKYPNDQSKPIQLYTHPHQWQGLTDDDMSIIFDKFDWKEIEIAGEHLDLFKFSHTIEQALKEKNT